MQQLKYYATERSLGLPSGKLPLGALVVNYLFANAGDIRDAGSLPG